MHKHRFSGLDFADQSSFWFLIFLLGASAALLEIDRRLLTPGLKESLLG